MTNTVITINTGMARGLEKGRLEGRLEGKQESMQQVALSMLKEGLSDEFIIKITGFDIQQLSTIKSRLTH